MLPAALALVAMALGARAAYPRWLEQRQARRRKIGPDGVVEGGERLEMRADSDRAVLVLHGAGDTPQVVAGLAKHLHARGFTVTAPLLAGHGRELAALGKTQAAEWHEQVWSEFDALAEYHSWVGVVGLSMGGALALDLAASRSDVAALVLLAPYVALPGPVRHLAETSRYWGWMLPYFSSLGSESIHDRDAAARGLSHGIVTPSLLRALLEVVNTAHEAAPDVRSPTLVIQSREDNRIAPEVAESAFARLGSPEKTFRWVHGAGHVITVDYGHKRVFEQVGEWLEKQLAKSGKTKAGPVESDPARRAQRFPQVRNARVQPGSHPDP